MNLDGHVLICKEDLRVKFFTVSNHIVDGLFGLNCVSKNLIKGPPTTSLDTLHSIPLMKALSSTLDVQPYTKVPWIIVDRNAEED
jgi:hypothetical protein